MRVVENAGGGVFFPFLLSPFLGRGRDACGLQIAHFGGGEEEEEVGWSQ